MSKTLEKNSVWETVKRSWRRFVGLGIDLRSKYWNDIFFRTEFNVIALQIVFAIVLSGLIVISFDYLYKDILQTIIGGITESIKNNGAVTGKDIVDSIQIVKAKNFLNFFTITLSVTILFSYLIARVTLYPTRNALKSQKRFISDIAHELRTPLSIIKTNSEIALLDEGLDQELRDMFKSNIGELDRASGIINNLLTFNKLVNPEQIQFGPVNMGLVVDMTIKQLEELATRRGVAMSVHKTSPYGVWGNTTALEQIVMNIVKNALHYTSQGGSVTVSVEPDYRGNVLFSVADTGIGISQSDLVHIFEPFYRAERSRNRQSGSSGLGLTIVSELVKLHSGKIRVRSRLKQGTVVTVVLPAHKGAVTNMNVRQKSDTDTEVSLDFFKK